MMITITIATMTTIRLKNQYHNNNDDDDNNGNNKSNFNGLSVTL